MIAHSFPSPEIMNQTHRQPDRRSPYFHNLILKGGLISLYVDSLAGSPPTYGYRVGLESYPPPITGTSTIGEVTDVIAVNGDVRNR